MVLTEISQLSSECQEWRQILRNYKEEFNDCRHVLLEICNKDLSKNQMAEVEHFENQFHIQLINIHDLKQKIKFHEKQLETDNSRTDNNADNTFTEHEILLDQFLSLENTLQELRNDFKNFINESSC